MSAPRRSPPTAILLTFFLPALAFLVAAAVATAVGAAVGYDDTRWLALHLYLVGGASGLILGAAAFFTGLFLAPTTSARTLRRIQLAGWNAGSALLPVGVLLDLDAVTAAAGLLLLAALGAFTAALQLQRRRIGPRRGLLPRWYLTAAGLLVVGIALGIALARDPAFLPGDGVGAHRTLNLVGWIGGAIVGTLHTLYPAMTGTRLPHPRLERLTYAAWLAGTLVAALGYGLGERLPTAAGYALLAVAAGLVVVNVAASARRARRVPLSAQLVGAAQAMLVVGLVVALAASLRPGTALAYRGHDALLELLAAGWIGLTILGALTHLLGTIARAPVAAQAGRWDRGDVALTVLAAGGLLVVVASELLGGTPADLPARTAVGIAYLVVAVRVARLAAGAVRATRRRPGAALSR
jgi:nitrite reductase (NO-forming)